MSESRSRSRRRPLALAVVAVLAVAAATWVLLGGSGPAAVDPGAALEQADAATDGASGSEGDTAGDADPPGSDAADAASAEDDATVEDAPLGSTVTGTWTVDTEAVAYDFEDGSGSFVGFRIEEELSSIGASEAVGRTPAVEGSVRIEDGAVTEAQFSGDARALTTDDGRRDDRTRAALGDGQLRFELTDAIPLDGEPSPGETVVAEARGRLTINGVTQPVRVPLEASVSTSGLLVVTSSFEVELADHEVDPPSAPIVLRVSDVATVEVQLFLTRSA